MRKTIVAILIILVLSFAIVYAGDYNRIPLSEVFTNPTPSTQWTLAADAIDTSIVVTIDLKKYINVRQLYWKAIFLKNGGDSLGAITFETSADNSNWTVLQTDSMYASDSTLTCDSLYTLGTYHRWVRWRTWTQVNAADTGQHRVQIVAEGIDND